MTSLSMTAEKKEYVRKRAAELVEKIKVEVLPEHRRRCEEKEKLHPTRVRFDDEATRALESNSLVAELRRLQKTCSHDWTDWQENKTFSTPAKTKRCTICRSNETVFIQETSLEREN